MLLPSFSNMWLPLIITSKPLARIFMAGFVVIWTGTVFAATVQSETPAPKTAPWLETMKESCTKGNTQDCLNVGVAYMVGELNGNKIAKDAAQAKMYINDGLQMGESRCKQGGYVDCYTVGLMYFEGGVIPTNLPRGLNFLQKSCKGGYKKACDWLDNSGLKSMM